MAPNLSVMSFDRNTFNRLSVYYNYCKILNEIVFSPIYQKYEVLCIKKSIK